MGFADIQEQGCYIYSGILIVDIDHPIIVSGASVLASGLVAFGVLKGKLYNYMTYDKHREICAAERKETKESLQQLFVAQKETHGMIKEIHGYIRAKNGGSL